MHLLLASFLPAAIGAALLPRQSSNNAYTWSAPDVTYNGHTILGSFDDLPSANTSSPGITATNYDGATSTSLNVTVQNLMPSVQITQIFAAVHSDNVQLFEVGKPLSDQLSSFVSDGSDDFSSLNSNSIYGTRLLSADIGPGQYLNFSVPLSLPSRVSNEGLSDALDDLDASMTLIGRIGVGSTFVAVSGMDLGDRRESDPATLYSNAAGFVAYSSGYVNESLALPAQAAYVLTYATS